MKVFLPIRAEGRNRLCNPSDFSKNVEIFPAAHREVNLFYSRDCPEPSYLNQTFLSKVP